MIICSNEPFSPGAAGSWVGIVMMVRVGGHGVVRGGSRGGPGRGVSESAAKTLRTGIGGEKNRGISTILFRRFGAIGAFVADLDNLRRRGPPRGGAVGRR